MDFLDKSPSPFQAVQSVIELTKATPNESELLPKGVLSYRRKGSGSIQLSYIPEGWQSSDGLLILGAHTDSPNLRLKAFADQNKENYQQLLAAPYGGLLLTTWMDRELGIAGCVYVRENNTVTVKPVLIRRPVAIIPNLAIHLNRGVNEKGLILNKQKHLNPILANKSESASLNSLIAESCGVDEDSILSHDLSLFSVQESNLVGTNQEFLASARLDNLASCYCAAMMIRQYADSPGKKAVITSLFDHEEVGSESHSGAASPFLNEALNHLATTSEKQTLIDNSILISLDMSHGVHPNYAEMHEPNHKPEMNKGPVVKLHQEQRYATTAAGIAFIKEAARETEIPIQIYQHRSDLGCGSTIGPISAANTGIETIDLGNAMLAMHSCRELCGIYDIDMLIKLLVKAAAMPLPNQYRYG